MIGGHEDDPALRETAELVHRVLQDATPRADFRASLRAQLVEARAETIARSMPAPPRFQPPVPARRRPAWRRPAVLAWSGAAAAAVVAVAVLVTQGIPGLNRPAPVGVAVLADVMGEVSVEPTTRPPRPRCGWHPTPTCARRGRATR